MRTKGFYIIIRGPLGSGKTTLSRKLAQKIGGEYINIDDILDENNLTKNKEDGYVSQKSFVRANEIVSQKAMALLEKGIPVIIDGNFYWRSQMEDLLHRLPFPYHVFTLAIPLDACIERDNKRANPHGRDAVRAVYAKSTEFNYGIIIDASESIDQLVVKLMETIEDIKEMK